MKSQLGTLDFYFESFSEYQILQKIDKYISQENKIMP